MTLLDLHNRILDISCALNNESLPLKKEGKDFDISLSLQKDAQENWFINVTEKYP